MQELLDQLNAHSKKHLIFDFDGTLVDLLVDWQFWLDSLMTYFHSYEPSCVEADFFAAEQNYFIAQYGPEVKKKIDEVGYEAEHHHSRGFIPRQELISLLPRLKEKYSLSIWSSNNRLTITPILEELGLDKYFDLIVPINDVALIKPAPDGFELIKNKYPYSPVDYLMIGDSRADAGAAQASGIDFFNVITKEYIKA